MATQAIDIEAVEMTKADLLALIGKALAGEEVVLAQGGVSKVRLVPCEPPTEEQPQREPLTFGAFRGKIWIADDFDELPPDIAEAFGMVDE